MKYLIVILLFILIVAITFAYYKKEYFVNNETPYIVDIAAGANHSVFLNKDGKILTCGKNLNGRLGTGNETSIITPISLENTFNVRSVFAGNVNTFFITTDGVVYGTGENSQGQLGIGNLDDQFAPVPIPFFKSIPIKKVAPGWYHTIFLATSGDVYVCGDNKYGQLGNGTNVATYVPIALTYLREDSATKLTFKCADIAAGQGHSVFVRTDNRLYTAGWNWYGQLGKGNTRNSNIPIHVGGCKTAYAGMTSTIVLNHSHHIYVCGDNTKGQLGIPQTITNQRSWHRLTTLPPDIKDICTGQSHTFFLTSKGDIYGVGLNEKGQLGTGHNNNIYKAEKLTFFKENVSKIAAGANHSLFITKEGGVYATGDNMMGGQIGVKNITGTNTPVLCDIDIEKTETGVAYKTEIVGV